MSSLPLFYVLVSEVLSTQVVSVRTPSVFFCQEPGIFNLRSLSMPTTLPILLNQTGVSVIYCL